MAHYHCPHGCEKPQPARYDGGAQLICGWCWFIAKARSVVFRCTPETCPDDDMNLTN
jgi:hypothetical protein